VSGAIEALLSEENWKRGDPLSLAVGQSQAIVRDVVLTKARAELAAKDAEIEELRRSRDGWQADALLYAQSRGCQEQMTDDARATITEQAKQIERLTDVQRRDRACLFGIYKTNARLRAALEHAASYMVTLCMDRPVHEDGEVVGHWQTVDWLIGLRELAEESHSIALSSLPPSDMRLVPVERLREIEFYDAPEATGREGERICIACHRFEADGHAPDCWIDKKIGGNT